MRVTGERRAVGMIGGEENAPRVFDQQKGFQTDRPLQGIDEVLVFVFKRHHTTPGIALNVHGHPFIRAGEFVIGVLAHVVAGSGDGLAEQNLADINGDIFVFIDRFGNLRCAGGKFEIAFSAVTVELDMGQVHGQAADALNGIQGGLHVARYTEIAAVHMQRMLDTRFL